MGWWPQEAPIRTRTISRDCSRCPKAPQGHRDITGGMAGRGAHRAPEPPGLFAELGEGEGRRREAVM